MRRTITLTKQQDNWGKAQISAGQNMNDSEYIGAAIFEGEQGGEPWLFDLNQFKQSMHATYAEIIR